MELQSIEQFNELLDEKNKLTVIDFFALWCGPCKMLTPIFEKVSNKFSNKVNFVKINIDNFNDLAAKYDVQSIPTIVFVKNQTIIFKHVGFIDEENLTNKILTLI